MGGECFGGGTGSRSLWPGSISQGHCEEAGCKVSMIRESAELWCGVVVVIGCVYVCVRV